MKSRGFFAIRRCRVDVEKEIVTLSLYLSERVHRSKATEIHWRRGCAGNGPNPVVITPVIAQIQFVWSPPGSDNPYISRTAPPTHLIVYREDFQIIDSPLEGVMEKRKGGEEERAASAEKGSEGWRMVGRGKRGSINGHGECGFNYCRRWVGVAVYISNTGSTPVLFAQFVAYIPDYTTLDCRSKVLHYLKYACVRAREPIAFRDADIKNDIEQN